MWTKSRNPGPNLLKISSSFTAIHHLHSRYGFAHIGRVGSVFITLSVTIERFFAITYPLKKLDLKRWLIFSSVSGAVLYNLPRFFELRYAHDEKYFCCIVALLKCS